MAACRASDDNAIRTLKDESGWLRRNQFFHFKLFNKEHGEQLGRVSIMFYTVSSFSAFSRMML